MKRMYQIPSPKRPPEGPTTQATFLYPVAQPVLREPRQPPPSSWTPIVGPPLIDPTKTFIFPVAQPSWFPGYRIVTRVRAGAGTTPSVSAQMPFTYPVSQPDRRAFYLESQRYRQDPVTRLDNQTIVPVVPYDLVPISQRGAAAWQYPQVVGPWTPLAGAAAAPADTAIYRLDPAVPAYYTERPKPRLIFRVIQGTTQNTDTPLGLPDQPIAGWWRPFRPSPDQPVQLTGAAVQGSFVFPKDQPTSSWYVRRLAQFSVSDQRLEGPTTQPSFIFAVDQPIASRFPGRIQLPVTVRVVDAAAPVRIQSDTFQGSVRPPVFSVLFDINRLPRLGPEPQFAGAAPVAAQLFLFPTDQPNQQAWTAGWRPYLWAAMDTWLGTQGPAPEAVSALFVTWNTESSLLLTWEYNDGTTKTWNIEASTFTTWKPS